MGRIKAPGIKRVRRGDRVELYWACSESARKAGYPIKTVPLHTDDPDEILATCRRLQGEMLMWLAGETPPRDPYDGTIGGLLRLYQIDPESSFRKLTSSTLRPYRTYTKRLEDTIGERRIERVIGKDVARLFRAWSSDGQHIGAARMALAVLKAALAHGAVSGKPECQQLRETIRLMRFESLPPRSVVFTTAEIERLRAASRPSVALATALQYETALRLYDVIGQWSPVASPDIGIVHGDMKWRGLMWHDIGEDMVLRYTPSKTAGRTGATIAVDLNLCPMALEEIARVPVERRVGPIIIHESTGLPYRADAYHRAWRKDATRAGIGREMWCRDIRASAITEGRSAGAATEDAAKVAGHAKPKITARVYDRDKLEASRRFSKARLKARNNPKT
jgi:hypothetical protein